MQKSELLYPKGSDGTCEVPACREIAEWIIPELKNQRLCQDHFIKIIPQDGPSRPKKIPHIVRKGRQLFVRCLICKLEWVPRSFDLRKEDPSYGRIPHKCKNPDCKNTILTMVGRRPRFDRV